MFLIHTALPFEGHPLIRALKLTQIASTGGGRLYANQTKSLLLLISGIGKKQTEKTLRSLLQSLQTKAQTVHIALNLGIAGTTTTEHSVGSAHNIQRLSQAGSDKTPYALKPLTTSLPCAELLTLESPCSDISKLGLEKKAQVLLDMEAFHFINIVETEFKLAVQNLHSIKIVSDFSDGNPLNTQALAKQYDCAIESILPEIRSII